MHQKHPKAKSILHGNRTIGHNPWPIFLQSHLRFLRGEPGVSWKLRIYSIGSADTRTAIALNREDVALAIFALTGSVWSMARLLSEQPVVLV